MTRRELNLAIFERRAEGVLWQPRLETWIHDRITHDTLPDRFRGLDAIGIYDELRCSKRYGATGLEHYREPGLVATEEQQRSATEFVSTLHTPVGDLETVHTDIWEGGELRNRRINKWPIVTADDLRVWTYLLDTDQFRPNRAKYDESVARVAHRGEPTMFLSSAGITDLIKGGAGLPQTYYLLADHPAAVEACLEAYDRRDDRMIEAALQLPCRIFNLGDHTTNEFTPPPILKKYCLPRWQKISARLHAHGRFVHSHWDGHSRLLLPYLQDTGMDAVEALTPEPMGDMTLPMIKEAVGDQIICLDLLPAIHFLSQYSTAEVVEFARRVIEMFAPRLILGVSDEISQVGEIEKIEAVSQLVDSVCGLAE